jgi:hypothetical protein
MPEQLGIRRCVGQGRAVHRQERPVPAAQGVHFARRHLLAGAGLPDDQHRGITGRQQRQTLLDGARIRIGENGAGDIGGRPQRRRIVVRGVAYDDIAGQMSPAMIHIRLSR